MYPLLKKIKKKQKQTEKRKKKKEKDNQIELNNNKDTAYNVNFVKQLKLWTLNSK